MITEGLQQVGAARSIVIDEANVVLAGNGVLQAAGAAGVTRVLVVEATGQELIAVRRRGLSAEQKRALALYDNRTSELAEWNPEQLRADTAKGLDLAPWFSDAERATWSSEKRPNGTSDKGASHLVMTIECPACGHRFPK